MELELISLNGSGILLDQVNNLAATVAKSQERKDRTTKLDHADRIIDILETEGELTLQSPLRTAVYLHDVIYTGSRNNQSYNGEFLSNEERSKGVKPEMHMVGGDLLKYWGKCIILLESERGVRKAFLAKHRSLPEKSLTFKITNDNIIKSGWI